MLSLGWRKPRRPVEEATAWEPSRWGSQGPNVSRAALHLPVSIRQLTHGACSHSSGPVTTGAGELFPGDGHIPREARACCEQSGPTSQVSVFLIGQNKLLQAPFC